MATSKKKQFLTSVSWRKVAYASAGSVIALGLILQICLDVHFWHVAAYPSTEPLTSMVIQAIKGVDKPAVLEPVSKRVYLPDANLVLPPAPKNMPDLLYSYNPAVDSIDAEASITVTNAVSVGISKLLNAESTSLQRRDQNTLLNGVPEAQACARGVHVVFGTKTKYDHLEFSATLHDGRTMQIYREATTCSYDLQPLTDYLKLAQSY